MHWEILGRVRDGCAILAKVHPSALSGDSLLVVLSSLLGLGVCSHKLCEVLYEFPGVFSADSWECLLDDLNGGCHQG